MELREEGRQPVVTSIHESIELEGVIKMLVPKRPEKKATDVDGEKAVGQIRGV